MKLAVPQQLVETGMFAMVGASASVVHFLAATLLIEYANTPIWKANIFGFLAALPVSYFGHAFLTFAARRYGRSTEVTSQSALRFATLAATGFIINQSSVLYFAEYLGAPHRIVIAATIIAVAGFLFLASKFWAFKGTLA